MIEIALRRGLSKVIANRRVVRRELGKIDRGWQGKKPAVGPAYVVGCVWGFRHAGNVDCWRYPDFLKGDQSCERRRPKAQGGFTS